MTNNMKIDAFEILDSIDQYVYCKNKSGVYIYANKSFSLIAGCRSHDDIIGKTDWDLPWKSEAKNYEESDLRVLEGNDLVRHEQFQPREGGTSRIILTKKQLHSDSGELIGIVGNFFDSDNTLILKAEGDFDEEKKRLHLGFTPEWLSFAEVRICFYLIHGFSAPKISEKTKISVSTVRYHIDNIKHKMQCDNKNDIPATAMKTGIAWKILSLQHVGELESER